jgi:predicted Holliday junction resolvase-like endonuclease
MVLGNKGVFGQKITMLLGLLLVLSLAGVAGLSLKIKMLKNKFIRQEEALKDKDAQLEDGRVKYTSLAARLHKEIKKVGELEEELKKYRR